MPVRGTRAESLELCQCTSPQDEYAGVHLYDGEHLDFEADDPYDDQEAYLPTSQPEVSPRHRTHESNRRVLRKPLADPIQAKAEEVDVELHEGDGSRWVCALLQHLMQCFKLISSSTQQGRRAAGSDF